MSNNTLNSAIDWNNIKITEDDLELIYNYLLEKENPMTLKDISKAVIEERIRLEKRKIKKENEKEKRNNYRPSIAVEIGETLCFPAENNIIGKVKSIRDGNNPELGAFKVGEIEFQDGTIKEYAFALKEHSLNHLDYDSLLYQKKEFDSEFTLKKFGRKISREIDAVLRANEELICIAGFWFPSALLSEINPGFLNLAEAVLEMEEGKPCETKYILDQIDYPMDSNQQLTEFSFNHALEIDGRFDKVGPTGIVLWALKLLEPEDVRKMPMTLRCHVNLNTIKDETCDLLANYPLYDELEMLSAETVEVEDSFTICLNYPHWKAGTLPLIPELQSIFPSATETDNIVFDFQHKRKNDVTTFQGWVKISKNYVCGLKTWYRENGIVPGSLFRISRGERINLVYLDLIPPRSTKDWVRTAYFDAKNHLRFETRRQPISTDYDDRLCIYVENQPQLDALWEQFNKETTNVSKVIDLIFPDLAQSNPQRIVHFEEIYAAVNMMYRIPPLHLFSILKTNSKYATLDNLYFKEKSEKESE